MIKEDLISVIVTIYNIENYLDECILSVLKQSYHNLEIILVDDGSTDQSGSICDKYESKDSRIKVIHKVNSGASSARNTGLDASSGKYIAFVDGDDWLAEDMYETLYYTMLQHDADVAFGVTKRQVREHYENMPNGETICLNDKEILEAYIDPVHTPHILKAVWDKIYKREIIGNTRFAAYIRGEDGAFNTVIMSKCKKVVFIGKTVYYYRDQRNGNISGTGMPADIIKEKIPIALEQIELLKKIGRNALAERQTVVFYSELMKYFLLIQKDDKYKEREILLQIEKIIKENKKNIRKFYLSKYSKNKFAIKMELFFLSSKLYTKLMRKKDKDGK